MRSKRKIKTKNRRAVRAQKEGDRRQKNLRRQKKCAYCKRRLEEKPKHITYSKARFKCHRKKQKRVTLLLGAGAVFHLKYLDRHGIEQEAISSSMIKGLIVNDTRYITKTKSKTVGEYIFDCLEKHFVDDSGVNFETFLAVLESLYDFVMDSTSENKKAIFNLLNPVIYTFLKQNTNDSFSINELNEDLDDREFFFNLWAHYYKLVVDSIANYSNSLTDSINSALNESFREYINYYIKNNYVVRIYTTNYDNFVPDIFKGYKKVFNGFSSQFHSDRIYQDRLCLNYYNLHGSIYWQRVFRGIQYVFEYSPYGEINTIEPVSSVRDNPGHQHIPTNIITGYNKLQRTSIEPFNIMTNSFFMDCIESDEIVTIGYSYSDAHINNLLVKNLSSISKKYLHITFEKKDNGQSIADKYMHVSKMEYTTLRDLLGNANFKQVPNTEKWLKKDNAKIYLQTSRKTLKILHFFGHFSNRRNFDYHNIRIVILSCFRHSFSECFLKSKINNAIAFEF